MGPFRRTGSGYRRPIGSDEPSREAERILHTALAGVFGEVAAREAAAQWGYGPGADLELLGVSENATYLLREGGREPAVLRLNRPGYHRRDEIASELAWTAALRQAGVVRTPRAIPTNAAEPLARLPPRGTDLPRHAVLFAYARGEHPADDPRARLAEMAEIGAIAARLHAHARSWNPPPGFCRFSWDLSAALGDGPAQPGRWGDWRIGLGNTERAVVQRAESQVRQALSTYGCAPARCGLIHADLRAANLLTDISPSGERRVTVIDFDDCGPSWFFYDLAASMSFLEHHRELPALVSNWLAGYRQSASVAAADLAALPSLVMLRRLQLQAWSSSHADTEMVHSLGPSFAAETMDVADRYLGARLLDGAN
jgi:Ser/Thr protein kinase RdoA (MazF antagonist)